MSNPVEALPGPCQEDLELLRNSIRELAGGHPGGAPVPADRFGAVFLTGATGFVGRFVLSELLRQNDHMLIHCLVRAGNAKQALARVQAALESAELWDDYLADRIRAWPGDLREPRFGLAELDFRRLCDQVDAVYHLAAERDLLAPYAAVREASTRGFRTVLELALRRRPKHLFYASTTEVFPPNELGYPWTSLVVEQALLSARSASLPVAIMRLPQLDLAAPMGDTPVDAISETLTAISLNPRRRHTIYHLRHPAPRTWGSEPDDFASGLDDEPPSPVGRLA
jgi:nucleoside-diphosphate-sugar epimerase